MSLTRFRLLSRFRGFVALFCTLCETAKLAGVDPHANLLRTLYGAMAESGAVTYREELLVSTPTT
jgi:hypothetical protein